MIIYVLHIKYQMLLSGKFGEKKSLINPKIYVDSLLGSKVLFFEITLHH